MPHPFFRLVQAVRSPEGPLAARLDIYDQIGEVTDWWTGETSGIGAAGFIGALQALDLQAGDTLDLHINSPGGDLHAGLSMYHELARSPATVTAYIDGQAASIASIIAMAADRIVMPPAASLWVHNPMTVFATYTAGYSTDMRAAAREALHLADDLDTYAASLAAIYAGRSGGKLTLEAARALMDGETLIPAAAAVEIGLADAVEEALPVVAFRDPRATLAAASAALAAKLAEVKRVAETPAAPPAAPVAMAAKAVVTACQDAGCPELAAGFIAADAPEAKVRADLATARDIRDRCAAADLAHQAGALIQAALSQGPGALCGAVLALKRADLDPPIHSHLPANSRPTRAANVPNVREIYAGLKQRRRR